MHAYILPQLFFFSQKIFNRKGGTDRERERICDTFFNKMEICLEKKCMNKMCVCMHTSCNVDVYVLVVKIAQCAIGNWVLKPLQKFRNSLIS